MCVRILIFGIIFRLGLPRRFGTPAFHNVFLQAFQGGPLVLYPLGSPPVSLVAYRPLDKLIIMH